jgi:hypothetical protein
MRYLTEMHRAEQDAGREGGQGPAHHPAEREAEAGADAGDGQVERGEGRDPVGRHLRPGVAVPEPLLRLEAVEVHRRALRLQA